MNENKIRKRAPIQTPTKKLNEKVAQEKKTSITISHGQKRHNAKGKTKEEEEEDERRKKRVYTMA